MNAGENTLLEQWKKQLDITASYICATVVTKKKTRFHKYSHLHIVTDPLDWSLEHNVIYLNYLLLCDLIWQMVQWWQLFLNFQQSILFSQ